MKLSELKHIVDQTIALSKYAPDEEVVVTIKMPYATVGAHPMMKIKSAGSGFDWESGKFMLWPEQPLTEHSEEFRKKFDAVLEENYRLKRQLREQKK